MTNARRPGNASLRGWFERHGLKRYGRNQIIIWRALTGYAQSMTTLELFEHVYPGFVGRRGWRLAVVRRAAERYGQRLEPRTRPLRWKLKVDVDV